jgi:hypothetical protein
MGCRELLFSYRATPVAFLFGWATYSLNALLAAFGSRLLLSFRALCI